MSLRVKEICKDQGITIGDLAERMKIKRESLSRAINGNPALKTLMRISKALNVPVSELFEEQKVKEGVTSCPNCGYLLKVELKK